MREYISREEAIRALLKDKPVTSEDWWCYHIRGEKQTVLRHPKEEYKYSDLGDKFLLVDSIRSILLDNNFYIYEEPKEKPKLEWINGISPHVYTAPTLNECYYKIIDLNNASILHFWTNMKL